MIETARDVPLENPLRCGPFGQNVKALLNGIRGAATAPKSVGVRVCAALRDRIQSQPMQGLARPVLHRRNAERAPLSVGLGNVQPPKWKGFVLSFLCGEYCFLLLVGRGPGHPVYSRGVPALIFRDSAYRPAGGVRRSSQNSRQSMRFATFPFLNGLRDSDLKLDDSELARLEQKISKAEEQ